MFKSLLPSQPGTEPLSAALRACRWHFLAAAVFSALVNLLYLAPTLYMMQVYDRVVPTGGMTTLVLITAVVLFALGSLALLDTVRTRLLTRAALRLDRLLADKVLGRVISAGEGGAHQTQAMREFDNVRGAISGQGALALFDAPWTPVYLLFCFLLHPALGALTLAGALVLFGLAVLNERDSRPRLQQAIRASGAAYATQESIANHAEVVAALGMRGALINRQIAERSLATEGHADAQFAGGRYSGAIKFLRLALQSLALGLGAYLAVKGEISAGAIIATSVLLSRAVSPIEQLVGAWPSLTQARVSWAKIVELFAQGAQADRPRTILPEPVGEVVLEGVSLRLAPGAPAVLKGIGVSLQPGQTLGVIGPSGAGKTMLARVLAGALPPTVGAIRLDGAEYSAWDSDRLARHIGYLPQSPTLFAGTVKENISRFAGAAGAAPELVDAEAVKAAQMAGAHELILHLPEGYDTVLRPDGLGVSAGQAQRIALARALYGSPRLLVLDEPNSNLDQPGEMALMQAIQTASEGGATIVLIAHRAGILARVDRLLVLRDGAVEMEGPREAVLKQMQAGQRTPGVANIR